MAATGRTNAPSPRASWARPPERRAKRPSRVVAAPGCPSATTATQRQIPSHALLCVSAPLRLCVVLLALSPPACWCQQPAAAARADYQQTERQAEALRKQGQFREAITACEAFFRAHPDATAGCQLFLAEKALANLVDRILLRDLKERDQTVSICEAALKEFEGVPYYWAVCAKYVIQAKMWRAGEQGAAADLANRVVEKLGEQLPPGYVGASLLLFHVYALRNLARCFKAHDLNLIRANQFLEFHRTGAGVNPLPELEGELANAVTP